MMRVFPLVIVFALTLLVKPAYSEAPDLFHEKIGIIASKFSVMNIPGLEKIQLPQIQPDGSFIFIYVWHPKTHRPTTASFEANIGDYFDIMGAQTKAFSGWCYLGKPETYVLKAESSEISVIRIRALGFHGRAPQGKCRGGLPGEAGQLGHTHVIKDPRSGLLSMVRSGHPTRFPLADERVQ